MRRVRSRTDSPERSEDLTAKSQRLLRQIADYNLSGRADASASNDTRGVTSASNDTRGAASASADAAIRWALGNAVEARFLVQQYGPTLTFWHPGRITASHADGSCDIRFDDGDREDHVPAKYIRPSEAESADELEDEDEMFVVRARKRPPSPAPSRVLAFGASQLDMRSIGVIRLRVAHVRAVSRPVSRPLLHMPPSILLFLREFLI